MRTITLRSFAGRAVAMLGALILTASPALAGDTPAAEPDRVLETKLDVGYRVTDTEDDRSLLFPYDPLADGPILGLDLLYLTPQIGALKLEAGFLDENAWQAHVGYNHGSAVGVRVDHQSYTHARSHTGPVPSVAVVTPPPAGMEVEGTDSDPGRTYRDERRETSASMKVRVPGYPAHLSASGRIDTHAGDQQMRLFYRSCSNHMCHVDSRTRELDQETRQYTVGLDAHAGPIDLAVSHQAQTYRDNADDPMAPGEMVAFPTRPDTRRDYLTDVNPDLRSFLNQLNVNTLLTNRAVLSLVFSDGEEKNETSDVSRQTRNAGAALSYRIGPSAALVARYAYDETTGEIGDAARAMREARNLAQAVGAYASRHQHVLNPEETRHTGEITARFSPVSALDVNARLRYRTRERYALIVREKVGTAFEDAAETTTSTLASVGGRYRVSSGLSFDASLGHEWTDGPVYAVETTGVTRYGLGATWAPAPVFTLQAGWHGFRGENDEREALQHAYAVLPPDTGAVSRTVSGDAFTAMASFTPAPAFNLTASWSLTENGVEQDMLFGSAANPAFSFASPDTEWSGRVQVADLRARWAATKRLALTAGGMWIGSLESYAPTFAKGAALEDISTVEFSKLLGTLQADVRVMEALGLTLAAFWAQFDDLADDAGDGTAQGVLAAVNFRW